MSGAFHKTGGDAPAGSVRTESDLLGEVAVPGPALYGAQTQRAILSFPVGDGRTIGSYPQIIGGLLSVKEAAAITNRGTGLLSRERADAIVAAVRRVHEEGNRDQFPVHRLHGGGGTSANMNVNEVLANLAEESLGGRRGEYKRVHPNDHVNLNQSTNDVYPTACHIAVLREWPSLRAAVDRLADAYRRKAVEFQDQPRLARTCLQDAVDTTFGGFFQAQAHCLDRARRRLDERVDTLHAVNLGGTIVGRAEDVPPAYLKAIVSSLRAVTGDEAFTQAADLFDAAQNLDDLAAVSAELDLLARVLIKMGKDVRLMASGPEAGLGEITLPAVQPGSSIMPGKINPVIPEFLIQCCFQVIGHHAACAAAIDHGELDVNVWESSVVFNILDAMELLAGAVGAFEARCVSGIAVVSERNLRNSATLIPLLTLLGRRFPYSELSELCRRADGDLKLLRDLVDQRLATSRKAD